MPNVPTPFMAPNSAAYLAALEDLTIEVQRAVAAIKAGALADFEESIVHQQISCARVIELREQYCSVETADSIGYAPSKPGSPDSVERAKSSLEDVTREYSMLLKHFGGTARLLSGMFRKYGDPAVAGVGFHRSQNAWSCEL